MRIALLSAVSLAVLATATAAQAGNPAWPNWYLGLKGGVSFLNDSDIDGTQTGKVNYDNGYLFSAALGYHPAFAYSSTGKGRVELEYFYQKNNLGSGNINGVNGSFTGDQSTSALMLNALYDFSLSNSRFAPYVGAGVGFASTDVSGGFGAFNANNDDSSIAWQLLAGIGYSPENIPFTTWSLGYRYFDAGEVSVNTSTGGNLKVDNDSHNIEAGVQLKF